ncbi:hypothetical protein J7L67_01915 [bacterium]|nr:hypothetical protein [bacterium]
MKNERIFSTPIEIEFKNTKEFKKMFIKAPEILAYEFQDAFSHIKLKFFKTLKSTMKVKRTTGYWKLFQGRVYPEKRIQAKKPENVEMRIWTRSRLAKIHERGGVITPKRAKMLAIPIGDAAKKTTKQVKKQYADKSKIKKLVMVEVMGKLYLVKLNKKRKRFLFALMKKVTVKPKLNFEKTWVSLKAFRAMILNQALDITVKKWARVK